MKRQLTISQDPIVEASLLQSRTMSQGMGAALVFPWRRARERIRFSIAALEYETFEKMAAHQFNLLFDQIAENMANRIHSPCSPRRPGESERTLPMG